MVSYIPVLTIKPHSDMMKEEFLMKNSESENRVHVGLYRRTASLDAGSSLTEQERVCLDFLDGAYGPGSYHVKVYTDEGFSGNQGFTLSEG